MESTKQSSDSWLQSLANYPQAAIVGFLQRAGLPIDGDRLVQLDRIRKEVAARPFAAEKLGEWIAELGRIDAELGRLDEAVASIKDFNSQLPLAHEFCVKKGIARGDNLGVHLDDLREALYKARFPLRDWIDFLDQKKRHGLQHLFLFRLQPGQEDDVKSLKDRKTLRAILLGHGLEGYLEPPQDPDALRAFLREHGLERYLKSLQDPESLRSLLREHGLEPPFVWETEPNTPKLAGVDHNPSVEGEVWVKLVETRHWLENQQPRHQRAVHFFRLDLASGDCEVRIQKLRAGGMGRLRAAFNAVVKELRQIVELDRFAPVLIEPAIRHFLVSPLVKPESWRVGVRKGVFVEGEGDFLLQEALTLAFRQFYAVEAKGIWTRWIELPIKLELDGKIDRAFLPKECDGASAANVLVHLRNWSGREPIVQAKTAAVGPELHAILNKIYGYLERLGQWRIEVDRLQQLAQEMWISFEELIRALETTERPEPLGAVYFVKCPDTGDPVTVNGEIVTYSHLRDVPKRVECYNRRERQWHDTRGKIWFTVSEPPARLSRNPAVRFLLVFVPLAIVTTLIVLEMLGRFQGIVQQGIIVVTYLALLVVEMAAAIAAQGTENLTLAVELVRKIVGLHKTV